MKKNSLPEHLTRTRFIKTAGAVIGGAAGAYVLYELAPWLNGSAPAAKVRMPLQVRAKGDPLMRELIRFATLAASGHNAQPWIFSVANHVIQIQPDRSRRLPAVDPHDRELWISLGCALENLCIAARKVGLDPEITYPKASDVITVSLIPRKPEEGKLFSSIPFRQNTRSEYDGSRVGAADMRHLLSTPLEEGISLRAFESHSDIEKVLEFVSVGNLSQFEDKPFLDELTRWIRFDKREALASMDGLYSGCMGSLQVPRWIGQKVLGNMAPNQQVDMDATKLRSSSGALAIASTSEDKASWVRTGQVYERLALKMTSMNIKSAFLNQPNEVPEVRGHFRSAFGFGKTLPQLLLRFGYADAMPSSYRRSVDDVILWP